MGRTLVHVTMSWPSWPLLADCAFIPFEVYSHSHSIHMRSPDPAEKGLQGSSREAHVLVVWKAAGFPLSGQRYTNILYNIIYRCIYIYYIHILTCSKTQNNLCIHLQDLQQVSILWYNLINSTADRQVLRVLRSHNVRTSA